jgi:hypothetical protein
VGLKRSIVEDPTFAVSKTEVDAPICAWKLLRDSKDLVLHQYRACEWRVDVGCHAYLNAAQECHLEVDKVPWWWR